MGYIRNPLLASKPVSGQTGVYSMFDLCDKEQQRFVSSRNDE